MKNAISNREIEALHISGQLCDDNQLIRTCNLKQEASDQLAIDAEKERIISNRQNRSGAFEAEKRLVSGDFYNFAFVSGTDECGAGQYAIFQCKICGERQVVSKAQYATK